MGIIEKQLTVFGVEFIRKFEGECIKNRAGNFEVRRDRLKMV